MLTQSYRNRRHAVFASVKIPDHHVLRKGQAGSSGELRMRIFTWRAANLHHQGQKCTQHVPFCRKKNKNRVRVGAEVN